MAWEHQPTNGTRILQTQSQELLKLRGATNSTYTPATNTVGEVFYFVIIAFDGGCSDIQSDIVLVNTVAEPTATAVNPEQTICLDGQADTFDNLLLLEV